MSFEKKDIFLLLLYFINLYFIYIFRCFILFYNKHKNEQPLLTELNLESMTNCKTVYDIDSSDITRLHQLSEENKYIDGY